MRKLACAGWLIVLLAAGPIRADGDKDKEKPPPKVDPKVDPKADPKAEPKLIPLGRVAGTLQSVGGTSGFLTLRVPIRRLEPNTQAIANLAQQQRQWLQRQAQIMRTPNPVQRQQQMLDLVREVQQAERNLFVVKDTHVDVEFQPDEAMKVRTATPDPGFDEMGNIRKLTPELLKELRGKEGLPGFKAEASDLRQGQTVLIVAARERGAKEANPRLIATLVMILAEPKQ